MPSPLRWGILGTARINRRIIPALQASGRSRLEAVASRDQARAAAYATEWNIPLGLGGYDPGLTTSATLSTSRPTITSSPPETSSMVRK